MLFHILSKVKRGLLRLYQVRFALNPNIKMGKGNYFYWNVTIDTNQSGKIYIGDKNLFMYGAILMTYGGEISIGNNCSVNPYTIIYGHGKGTKIGNNVLIAGHTMIIPANHVIADKEVLISKQGVFSRGIVIEDDVWIGAGCTILDGGAFQIVAQAA